MLDDVLHHSTPDLARQISGSAHLRRPIRISVVRHVLRVLLLVTLGAALCTPLAHSQQYPSKPILLVVPAAPESALDAVARSLQAKLGTRFGQPVIIENRGGTAGAIGGATVARSAPDGHTLLLATSFNLVIQPALMPELPYKLGQDLVPIYQIATSTYVLVAQPNAQAQTLKDLEKLTRNKALTVASTGPGSPGHLLAEIYRQATKANVASIPYRSSAQGLIDVIGGQVDTGFFDVGAVLPHVRSGKLRPLAVTSTKRSSLLPDVPTFAESGLREVTLDNSVGILAPSHTPASTIAYLERAVADVLQDPALKGRFATLGFDVESRSQSQFAASLAQESQRWMDISKRYAKAAMIDGGGGSGGSGGGSREPISTTTGGGGGRGSGGGSRETIPTITNGGNPQWNAWFQRDNKVEERLELGKDYRFVLDISRLSRKSAAAVAVSPQVAKEIADAASDITLTIRVMLIGGALEPSAGETKIERSLQVSVGKLQQVGLNEDEQKRWQAGKLGTREYLLKASAGQMSLGVVSVVGSSRVDLQACKLEYSIVSPK